MINHRSIIVKLGRNAENNVDSQWTSTTIAMEDDVTIMDRGPEGSQRKQCSSPPQMREE